jgi:ribosomal protein S18 acetylase RimI-like enzyme
MWRDLNGDVPEPVWADGVTVRTYDDADGERVHQLLDDTYRAWDTTYVPQSREGWLAFMTDHDEFDPKMWFLAERDGELVACALHWKAHERRGWVKDIVVVESERGRGLAKALLHHAFDEYAKRGVERVGLKVDSSNPTGAPQLYERVGFTIDRRYGTWVKRL